MKTIIFILIFFLPTIRADVPEVREKKVLPVERKIENWNRGMVELTEFIRNEAD